jgi:general secretion pathway protein L
MSGFQDLREVFSRWIDRVAAVIVDVRDGFRTRRQVQLTEQKDGSFILGEAAQADGIGTSAGPFQIAEGRVDEATSTKLAEVLRGAQVGLFLQPNRFMVRVLELPRRASDFLDGIVRAQIDRLTPWSAANAAFGWHPSIVASSERIVVTIAATSRTSVAPLIEAVASFGADLITVSAVLQEPLPDAAAIVICEHKVSRQGGLRRIRRLLIGSLAGAGALAALSAAANNIVGGMIEARRDEVTSRISERRATLQQGHDRASDAVLELERRKQKTPSSAIIIEALSRILPDDTYLTELHIVGDKLQIVGVSRDAPSLIRLIEQTHHFSHAAFFAPTTRSATETREHFSIEAHIEPVYTPGL